MQNYLQQILTESNTIIIPGLGALTITSTKTGDIYFMPFLKHDDGSLAKYIAKVEEIELVDAKNTISNFVQNIQSSLENGGNYEMEGFGRFLINKDGEIDFQRWEDYQIKDTPISILSKKINERKLNTKKTEVPKSTTTPIEKPIVKEEAVKIEEPIKTDAEIHERLEEELPISSNPIHLSIEETIIHPIEEPITDNISINELLSETEIDNLPIETIQNKESDITHNEYITLIEESSSETHETENIHDETNTEDEIMENSEIKIQTEPSSENSLKTIIQTKEDKKALRKKLKNERAAAKAAEKRLKKGFQPENKEIVPPKEKKKSRSMILWLFSAILITIGTMWFIKTQRDNKVHLTVIDKNQSKIITNKVIEKKQLHKELSKHSAEKVEEKQNTPAKTKETANETIIPVDIKPKTNNQKNNNLTSLDSKSVTHSNTSTKSNTLSPNVKTENTSSQNTKTTPPVKINSVIISSTPIITPVPAPQKTKTINPNPAYTSPDKNIHVIVGTFKDKASADHLLNNLKTDGFNSAYTKELNGSFQVSLGSFTTLSESKNALQKYRGVKD